MIPGTCYHSAWECQGYRCPGWDIPAIILEIPGISIYCIGNQGVSWDSKENPKKFACTLNTY